MNTYLYVSACKQTRLFCFLLQKLMLNVALKEVQGGAYCRQSNWKIKGEGVEIKEIKDGEDPCTRRKSGCRER